MKTTLKPNSQILYVLFHYIYLHSQLRRGEKSLRAGGAVWEGRGDWMEMGCGTKKIEQDFISQPHLPPTDTTFPFPTLSWTPLRTHTHIHHAPWFTHSQNCTRCHIKSLWPRHCSQMKNLSNSGKYLESGSGLKWLRPGEVEVKPLQV